MNRASDERWVAVDDPTDRVVDALLRLRHERPIDRERRIARVMRSVRRGPVMMVRWAGGLVAAAAVAMILLVGPSSVNAADQARHLATRSGSGGDRRAMFVVSPPGMDGDRPPISGSIDVRDASHMVLTLRTPDGGEEVFGRDGDRAWNVVEGRVREMPAGRPWPVWIQSPRGGLLVDLPEMIESGLSPGWTWMREAGKPDEPGTSRLVATRKQGPPAEPVRIEVVTNDLQGTIKRAEIGWATPDRRMPGEGPPHPGASDRRGPAGMPPPPIDRARGDRPPPRADGADHPPPATDHPMRSGIPGSLVLIPEPPVTFPADWFSPERLVRRSSGEGAP